MVEKVFPSYFNNTAVSQKITMNYEFRNKFARTSTNAAKNRVRKGTILGTENQRHYNRFQWFLGSHLRLTIFTLIDQNFFIFSDKAVTAQTVF